MKKKVDENESVPLVDFSVRGDEAYFSVDGWPRFKMRTDTLLRLINRELVASLRDNQSRDEELEAIDSLLFYARVQRLLRRGFSAEEAAQVVGITPDLFRRYLAYGMGKYRDPQQVRAEIERQQQAEGDFCKRKPRPQTETERTMRIAPPDEFIQVNAARVRDMLKAGKGFKEICDALDLDEKGFEEWYKINRELVDYRREQ